jgi:hypothetical protein
VSDFKKLHVWQKAHALALHAHRIATGIRRSHDIEVRKMIHGLLNKIGQPDAHPEDADKEAPSQAAAKL